MSKEIVTKAEFAVWSRELAERINTRPPPVEDPIEPVTNVTTPPQVEVDDSIDLADRLFEEPDRISGLPKPEPSEIEFRPAPPKVDTTFPGFSLDPDVPSNFIETGPFGKILLGPPEDKDEPAETLAASYGT